MEIVLTLAAMAALLWLIDKIMKDDDDNPSGPDGMFHEGGGDDK